LRNDRNEKLGPIQQSLDNLRKIIINQNDSDNSAVEIDDNPIKSICIENYKEITSIDGGKNNELIIYYGSIGLVTTRYFTHNVRHIQINVDICK
jgi:hypothetical protein